MSSFCSLIHSQVVSNILFCCGAENFRRTAILGRDFVDCIIADIRYPWFDPLSTDKVFLTVNVTIRYHDRGILFYSTTSMVRSAGDRYPWTAKKRFSSKAFVICFFHVARAWLGKSTYLPRTQALAHQPMNSIQN